MSKQTEPSIVFVHGMITDAITAVVINAQAGLQLLRAQSPDLEKSGRRSIISLTTVSEQATSSFELERT